MARCPAHKDDTASLKLDEGTDGRVLLHCHAGCDTNEILSRVGLSITDLFPKEGRMNTEPTKVYQYKDEGGGVLFEVCRYELDGGKKTFRQRHMNGSDEYKWNLDGVRRVPYGLPQLLKAPPDKPIFIVEGEKDVQRLFKERLVATTNPGGAGKWRDEYNEPLRGRQVVVLPDNDPPGKAHAEAVARSLQGCARSVKILALPELREKGDVSDWLDAGHTAEELLKLTATTPDAPRTASRTAGFEFTSLSDLMNEPEIETDWLVDGMLPVGGISIMAARPKVGKSTLARNLALAVARGSHFLHRHTTQGRVLYVALEERRADVARQFARMGAQSEPIAIHTGSAPERALQALTDAIIEFQPSLVVIDPLIRFFRFKDANDYNEVYRTLGPIVELSQRTNCHILLLHHTSKLSVAEHGSAALMASTAFGGAVHCTFLLNRNYETNQRTVFTEQRTGLDMPPTVIHLDPDTDVITDVGEVDEVLMLDTMRRVEQYLRLDGEWHFEKEIRQAVVGDTTRIGNALRRMYYTEGSVERDGTGKPRDAYRYRVNTYTSERPSI
jgi:putative DNA primase/helicase